MRLRVLRLKPPAPLSGASQSAPGSGGGICPHQLHRPSRRTSLATWKIVPISLWFSQQGVGLTTTTKSPIWIALTTSAPCGTPHAQNLQLFASRSAQPPQRRYCARTTGEFCDARRLTDRSRCLGPVRATGMRTALRPVQPRSGFRDWDYALPLAPPCSCSTKEISEP
jgi:hypothetical protein